MKQWRLVAVFVLAVIPATAQISPQFFGMSASNYNPWPSAVGIELSSWRSLSTNVKWSDINTAPGVYQWSNLDTWLATAQQYGTSVMYTFFYTPTWASSCPKCLCADKAYPPGGCAPPSDLNRDGSGTDHYLKAFIAALMQHVGPGKIQYLEIWNEPNISNEYIGTVQQLVRMSADVRAIAKSYDPSIQISSPAETGDGPTGSDDLQMTYLAKYLAAGGGPYVDVIGLHGYVAIPEDLATRIDATTADMAQYGQSGKPIFITEGGWENNPYPTTEQPGFTFRHHLAALSRPVTKQYLYSFDLQVEGNLYDSNTGQLTTGGTAYQLYYNWLVGTTMTQPCQAQSPGSAIWSCTFSRSGGYQAEAIWNTSLPWGQTTNVTIPAQYIQYRDLYGNVNTIQNNQVPIGFDPIWLEN